jgi:hypothetical protein
MWRCPVRRPISTLDCSTTFTWTSWLAVSHSLIFPINKATNGTQHFSSSTLHRQTCHALSTEAAPCQEAHSGPSAIFCTWFILLDLLMARTFFVWHHSLTAKDRDPGRLQEDIPRVPRSDGFNLSRQIGHKFTDYETQLTSSLWLNRFYYCQISDCHSAEYWTFCSLKGQIPTFHKILPPPTSWYP